jgi:aliphatic nitrilase
MGDTYPTFTVAAVQASSVFFDRDRTIDKALLLIEEAADKGAVMVGFPELFISGHPDLWYHAKKSNPLPRQGELFRKLVKNGIKVPSPETDRLCTAAQKAHAYLVIGATEVDPLFPGTLYISQIFISDQGEIMGVHRKMVPTVAEKLVYSQGDGSYLNVYDTRYGRISALVCGEHTNSLYKYALLAMGTQIHVAGWPPFPANVFGQAQRDSVDFRVRQFAHEGKIFVINSCGIINGQNIDVACDNQEEKDDIVTRGGGSSIIGPNGEYIAGPVYDEEAVLTADISIEEALPGKMVQNVLGHYSRWDVLTLNFNRKRLSPFDKASIPGNETEGLWDNVKEGPGKSTQVKGKTEAFLKELMGKPIDIDS